MNASLVTPDNAAALMHIAWRGQSAVDWQGLAPDIDALVGEIEEHRLAGRARELLDGGDVPWAGAAFRASVAQLCDSVEADARRHRQVLAELAARGGDDIIVIKGMSSAELLGDPTILRCGDIDAVPRDEDRFCDQLLEIGFERTRDAMVHEVGEFTRDGVAIDVQSYFPVYSLPPGLPSASGATGVVLCREPMPHERITFDVLDASRVDRRFRVGGPEVSALLMGAHAFMNVCNVWSISHREKAYLRLGELADVRELRALPSFDRSLAATLERELVGTDATAWVDWVLDALPASLEGGRVEPMHPPAPRCLWWNVWYDVPTSASELLSRWWLDMGALVRSLPHQGLQMGDEARSLDGESIQFGPAPPSLRCTAGVGPDAPLVVDVVVEQIGDAEELRIRFDAGSVGADIVVDRTNGTTAVTGDPVGVEVHAAGPDVRMTIVLPRALLVERGVADPPEGVLVGSATASAGRVTSGTALTLALER